MFAVISHRVAVNVTVDGQLFEHQRWTLLDVLSEAIRSATLVPAGQVHPELRAMEVDGPEDPRLGAIPVVGYDPGDAEVVIPVSAAAPLPDLAAMTDTALKRLARSLDINGNQPRADLALAIQAKHIEAETKLADAEHARQAEAEALAKAAMADLEQGDQARLDQEARAEAEGEGH